QNKKRQLRRAPSGEFQVQLQFTKSKRKKRMREIRFYLGIMLNGSGNHVRGKFDIPPRGRTADFQTYWQLPPSVDDLAEYDHWIEIVRADLSQIAKREIHFEFTTDREEVPAAT